MPLFGTSLFSHERERRTDSSIHGILDYEHGNSDNTPSYLQDRVSSCAQGARPKENSLSTVQLNTSINQQLPSQGSSFRDSSRSLRPVASTDLHSPQRDNSLDFRRATSRNEATTRITSGRISPVQQRPASDNTTNTEGRRTTRHLLSRLASSMSSTFISRRSSQDSINGRSPDAEEAHSSLCKASPQPSPATPGNMYTPENRPSEQSRGFTFFRRRRRGLSTVSPNQSSESEAESYRSEDSEMRTPASWLPSSLRNRWTPLFSRRRREGRHETARASSTSDSGRTSDGQESEKSENSRDPEKLKRIEERQVFICGCGD
ncbi:E3 ubiquitin-protein ligase MARCHF7-like [Mixophyes fleayi]|uniref:E3 ubiquitin-protein ligase MARCHF7-like n=1 Tax=Mixophyes fleayi TaxID=3061075 RepID=UPI003F4DC757